MSVNLVNINLKGQSMSAEEKVGFGNPLTRTPEGDKTLVWLGYISYPLWLIWLGFFLWIFCIVVIFIRRNEGNGIFGSHFRNHLHIVKIAILVNIGAFLVGLVLAAAAPFASIGLAYFVGIGLLIWVGFRVIKGMIHISNGEEYPFPLIAETSDQSSPES